MWTLFSLLTLLFFFLLPLYLLTKTRTKPTIAKWMVRIAQKMEARKRHEPLMSGPNRSLCQSDPYRFQLELRQQLDWGRNSNDSFYFCGIHQEMTFFFRIGIRKPITTSGESLPTTIGERLEGWFFVFRKDFGSLIFAAEDIVQISPLEANRKLIVGKKDDVSFSLQIIDVISDKVDQSQETDYINNIHSHDHLCWVFKFSGFMDFFPDKKSSAPLCEERKLFVNFSGGFGSFCGNVFDFLLDSDVEPIAQSMAQEPWSASYFQGSHLLFFSENTFLWLSFADSRDLLVARSVDRSTGCATL